MRVNISLFQLQAPQNIEYMSCQYITLRKKQRMRRFKKKVLMRTTPMEEEVTVDGENYTVTNLIICTLHQIH